MQGQVVKVVGSVASISRRRNDVLVCVLVRI